MAVDLSDLAESRRSLFGPARDDRPSGMTTDDASKQYDAGDLIDRIDRKIPPASPAEAKARGVWERLIRRLGELDLIEPPPGWEERMMARWEREHRREPTR